MEFKIESIKNQTKLIAFSCININFYIGTWCVHTTIRKRPLPTVVNSFKFVFFLMHNKFPWEQSNELRETRKVENRFFDASALPGTSEGK